MLANRVARWLLAGLMIGAVALPVLRTVPGFALEDQQGRKIKTRVEPAYPELARRMNLSGTVKFQVVVGTDGTAKDIKPVGGNPVLIQAAADALKKWRWTPGEETTEVVAFRFEK